MNDITRRDLLGGAVAAAALAPGFSSLPAAEDLPAAQFRFGLCTYLWGRDWTLPELIANCEKTAFLGVELRTQHKHGVEAGLDAAARREVKKRFADSPVTCVGPGCNWQFHQPDEARFKKNIAGAKASVRLSRDIGGTGVKVKPNALVKGEEQEKTVARIAAGLNEVGRFAADHGQEIRVEVHGRGTSSLPVMKAIFEQVTEKSVGVCWNSNAQDLEGKGLAHNFNIVADRLAGTAHVRELDGKYPYPDLMNLFRKARWDGWMLLEARTKPKDRIAAMKQQMALFKKMTTA